MSQPVCTVQYIDHVGVAVRDLEAALKLFTEVFGATPGEVIEVPDQGVRGSLLKLGQTRLELLQPLDADTVIGRFLAKRGEGLHHLAFNVENIIQELEGLKVHGVELVDHQPRLGMSGLIAFLHPKSVHGVLTELVQTP